MRCGAGCVRGSTIWARFLGNKKRGLVAAWFFCLYFYFINLVGVKWTFLGKYIWLRELGLGGMGVV
jgi:hypothetical protein